MELDEWGGFIWLWAAGEECRSLCWRSIEEEYVRALLTLWLQDFWCKELGGDVCCLSGGLANQEKAWH